MEDSREKTKNNRFAEIQYGFMTEMGIFFGWYSALEIFIKGFI